MPVKIVTGNIGAGKTRYCIDGIWEKHTADPSHRCVMIVPSHYSHETEKMIIDEFGGTGLNNIEVTSLEKLARGLLAGTEKKLSAPGKQSLICRAVELTLIELDSKRSEFDSKLTAAVARPGFLDIAASLISELHRYSADTSALRGCAEQTGDGILRQKLRITAMIAENYEKLLGDTEYVDSDEDMLRLAAVIGEHFDNTSIWIDKFDELLPQQEQVLVSLINTGADIVITFNVCDDESDTYYGTRAAIAKLRSYSDAEIIHLDGGMSHIKAPDLKFLFSTWFDRAQYDGDIKNAEVFEARDAYTEIEHTACRILDLVREEKYRYRDISVICGSPESYNHIIEAVFDEYGIPYYSDDHLSVSEHPIALQVLSLFDIIERNWDYFSMFEYLRAGFVYTETSKGRFRRLAADDIDILENYVLKYGIRGRNAWNRSWLGGQKNAVDEALGRDPEQSDELCRRAEELRKIIVEPLNAYYEAAKKAVTVTDYCCALFEFLENINLYRGLKAELLGMAMNRATSDAQRFGQIWNLILDVLDQVNTALGTCEVTSDEFCGYIRAAMTKCEIRTIPSGVDRVFIGSVEKNQAGNPRVLFVTGAVSGTFPTESAIEGFLSNSDREYLESKHIRLAPTTVKRNAKQHNSVYKALSAVKEKLCISYPVQTPESKACRASQTVLDICSKLKGIRLYNDIIVPKDEEKRMYISSPRATLHKLLINPKNNPLWTHVNAWFREHDEWRGKLFSVNRTRYEFSKRNITLNPSLAGELYKGQVIYSATRLNTYAECPFRYYLQYGLRARAREEWELNAADTGSYAHELIRRFCEYIDADDKLNWRTIDNKTCDEIIDRLTEETIKNINSSDINKKEYTADIFARMGRTVKAAAKTVCRSIACGEFETYAYEQPVRVSLTENVGVTGIIDRLDVCRHDGVNEYRIVDYKTGKHDFSVAEIYNGYDMQPVIYAMVMRMLDNRAKISGTYYSLVRNDFAKIQSTGRESTAENHLRDNVKLAGATFVDTDENGNIKPGELDRIESGLSRSDGSLFFGKLKGEKTAGNVRSRRAGEQLMETVRSRIIESDRKIRGGDIALSPLVHDSMHSACTYCDYSAVCRFDEELQQQRIIQEKDSEIWSRMEEEQDDMDA